MDPESFVDDMTVSNLELNGLFTDMDTIATTNYTQTPEHHATPLKMEMIEFPDELQSPKKKTISSPDKSSSLASHDNVQASDSSNCAIPFPPNLESDGDIYAQPLTDRSQEDKRMDYNFLNDISPTTNMYASQDFSGPTAYQNIHITSQNEVFYQQQQQQYLRMLHQQRYLAAIQQQNSLMQSPPMQSITQNPGNTHGSYHPSNQNNNLQNTPIQIKHQPWHSSADLILRKEMIHHIIRLLRAQKTNSTSAWLQKLPVMAKRLEEECYGNASTREEYANTNTLHVRLKAIVRAAHGNGPPKQAEMYANVSAGSRYNASPIPFPNEMSEHTNPVPALNNTQCTHLSQTSSQAIKMPAELQSPNQIVPDIISSPESMQIRDPNTVYPLANQHRAIQLVNKLKVKAKQVTAVLEESKILEYHHKLQSISTSDLAKSPESRTVLHRQQERLLILRHALWCKSVDRPCKVLSACGEMKYLWKHMMECQEVSECKVSHCLSSRYVLSHFERCVHSQCVVCQIVRFPVEMKEKDGSLMLDTERILKQLAMIMRCRRTPAESFASVDHVHNLDPNGAPWPMDSVNENDADQMGSIGLDISQPLQNGVIKRPLPELSVLFGSCSEEDRRQLAIMHEKIRIWSLEQLLTHGGRLESWAQQMQNQMSVLVRECRQLLQLTSNISLDIAYKAQYDAQLHSKRALLKAIDTKYKRCSLQYRLVKYVITSKQHNESAVRTDYNNGNTMLDDTSERMHFQQDPQHFISSALSAEPPANVAAVPHNKRIKAPASTAVKVESAPPGDAQIHMDANAEETRIKLKGPKNVSQKCNLKSVKKAKDSRRCTSINQKLPEGKQISLSNTKLTKTKRSLPTTAAAQAKAPTSLPNELSDENLQKHIDSLVKFYNATMTVSQLKKKLEVLLKTLMDHKFGWVFSSPVDTVALGIPDYYKTVRRPMDLGTIKKKLDLGIYKHMQNFASDVRLTFENALLYNSEGSDVYNLARDMLNDFDTEFHKLKAEINEQERIQRKKETACRLCGVERMLFEPPVLYCNGECNARIRRNCYYYVSTDNKYHCCHPCFTNLNEDIKSAEGFAYTKQELQRKKNDVVHEEPWVQCDKCNRWVHQICALFNGKIDAEKKPPLKTEETKDDVQSSKDENSSSSQSANHCGGEFLCPECLLRHRKKEPEKYKATRHIFSAKDLARTKLSDHLELWIAKVLKEEREDEAKWTNRDVSAVLTAENLTIRQVSNIDKQLLVRDKMYLRYKESHKYTSEHRFKSKCICMFQEIHGVSVLLFGMYVHEFDEQEAECNSRRVYISYLDSVSYFEPTHLRTRVYHELLIAYLDFVKRRGFYAAHIWACPPLKGDDYILYCHPETQKTPKSERLRQWYVDMLVKAQERGIVWHITNLYDDYWRNDNCAGDLPYFEGDYWVGLAEELIEKMEKVRKKAMEKKSYNGAKRKKSLKTKKQKRRKASLSQSDSGLFDSDQDLDGKETVEEEEENELLELEANDRWNLTKMKTRRKNWTHLLDTDRTVTDPLMTKLGQIICPMKDDFLVVKLQPFCHHCNQTLVKGTLWIDRNGKTTVELNPKIVQLALCDACYLQAKTSFPGKEIAKLQMLSPQQVSLPLKCTDLDENNDNEFFDTRQAFLSLCQGNHYQFDELRRAKHSSMMALYHLGHPNPNAYVYECNHCSKDIMNGNRWHCFTCPDFDVCDACHQKEKHTHPLQLITCNVSSVSVPHPSLSIGDRNASHAQQQSREAHAKTVRLHLQLLVHSSGCVGTCGSKNCEKMKELMRHGAQCKQRAYGGCTICRRVWALLQLHSRQCRQNDCKVPRCADLREHFRKLQLQQQMMDDRRRAAVTQQYRQMQRNNSNEKKESRDTTLTRQNRLESLLFYVLQPIFYGDSSILPHLLHYEMPKQNCPNMVGPLDSDRFFCRGREFGECDRRLGLCHCENGYIGRDCSDCAPTHVWDQGFCRLKQTCPNDCSNGGICNELTGKCDCFKDRKGLNCSEMRCGQDSRCIACGEDGICTGCDEGHFVDPVTHLCVSCVKAYDSRCLRCDALACLHCADLLLSSIRRSGARSMDSELPKDELEREIFMETPTQDLHYFDIVESAYRVIDSITPLNESTCMCIQGQQNDASVQCTQYPTSHTVCGHEGVLQFRSSTYTVYENDSSVWITVDRNGGGVGELRAMYRIQYHTASASDASPTAFYTSSTEIVMAPSVISLSFRIAIHDDHIAESDESFELVLELALSSSAASLGRRNTTFVTIIDDDHYSMDSMSSSLDTASLDHLQQRGGIAGTVSTLTLHTSSVHRKLYKGGDLFLIESGIPLANHSLQSEAAKVAGIFLGNRTIGTTLDLDNGTYLCHYSRVEARNDVTVAIYALYEGGLRGYYYTDAYMDDAAVISRIDAVLNFTWSRGLVYPAGDDFVGIRWVGRLEPKVTGDTTIHLECDDHARLYLNDQLIIDHWDANTDRGPVQIQTTVSLNKNTLYPIMVEYREILGEAILRLGWSSSDFSYEVIPSKFLKSIYHIQSSPFTNISIAAMAKTSSEHSILFGQLSTTAGLTLPLYLLPKDVYGNRRRDADLESDFVTARMRFLASDSEGLGQREEDALAYFVAKNQTYHIDFMPQLAGIHDLYVYINNLAISGCPYRVHVLPGSFHPLLSVVSGNGLDKIQYAGVLYTLMIISHDAYDNRIFTGGKAPLIKMQTEQLNQQKNGLEVLSIRDTNDGMYNISYRIRLVGNYKLFVYWIESGMTIGNSPYLVTVLPNTIFGPKCIASVQDKAIAAEQNSITVSARDLYGNEVMRGGEQFAIALEQREDAKRISGICSDIGSGQYICLYIPERAGLSRLHIYLMQNEGGHEVSISISNSPFIIEVVPGEAFGANCVAHGLGLVSMIAGDAARVSIILQDLYRNKRENAGHEAIETVLRGPLPLTDTVASYSSQRNRSNNMKVIYVGKGEYTVTYWVQKKGFYMLSILVQGAEIASSPSIVHVLPGKISANTSSIDLIPRLTKSFYANDRISIRLTGRDALSNALESGSFKIHFDEVMINSVLFHTDERNGSFLIELVSTQSGKFSFSPSILVPNGLNASYFSTNEDFDYQHMSPFLHRHDSVMQFDDKIASSLQKMPDKSLAIRWQGYISPVASDIYTFELMYTGKVLLFNVAGQDLLLSAKITGQEIVRHKSDIFLRSDAIVPIELIFAKPSQAYKPRFNIYWKSFSMRRQLVSSKRLYAAWTVKDNMSPLTINCLQASPGHSIPVFPGEIEGKVLTTAGRAFEFSIISRDRFENDLDYGGSKVIVQIPQLPQDKQIHPKIDDFDNGTYRVHISPVLAGRFALIVALIPKEELGNVGKDRYLQQLKSYYIQNSSFLIQVDPDIPCLPTLNALDFGFSTAVAGVAGHFEIQLRDVFGNRIKQGGSTLSLTLKRRNLREGGASDLQSFIYPKLQIADLQNGLYNIRHTFFSSGIFSVYIKINEREPYILEDSLLHVIPNVANAMISKTNVIYPKSLHVLRVDLFDAYGNALDGGGNLLGVTVHIISTKDLAARRGSVQDLGNGSYLAYYGPAVSETDQVKILLAEEEGISAYYFTNNDFLGIDGASFKAVEPNIAFAAREQRILRTYTSVKWIGYLKPRYTEMYRLQLDVSNDGIIAILWIDEVVLLDVARSNTTSVMIDFEADQMYKITVDYQFQPQEQSSLFLYWQSPRQEKEIIPSSVLHASAGEIVETASKHGLSKP